MWGYATHDARARAVRGLRSVRSRRSALLVPLINSTLDEMSSEDPSQKDCESTERLATKVCNLEAVALQLLAKDRTHYETVEQTIKDLAACADARNDRVELARRLAAR